MNRNTDVWASTSQRQTNGARPKPTAATFTVTVEHTDGCATVSPHGEIDIATAPALQDAIVEALGSGVSALVIDLAGVRFLDSSAIQIFSKTAKQLWDAGQTFALASATPEARRVLDLVGLSAKFGLNGADGYDPSSRRGTDGT